MNKALRIVFLALMGLVVVAVIVGNVVCGILFETITRFFHGDGIDFGSATAALNASTKLCRQIEEEGIVMLKNENEALPLSEDVTKLNVFGWGSTDNGFVVSGSGSGSSDERGNGAVSTFLDSLSLESYNTALASERDAEIKSIESNDGLSAEEKEKQIQNARNFYENNKEDYGFEYNKTLTEMYEKFRAERFGTSLNNPASDFFRLYEPGRSYYTEEIMSEAREFSDTALVVISRLGGEGQDIPLVQYKQAQTGTSMVTDNSKTYLQLSDEEREMFDVVTGAGFETVIVILNTCNTMELGFLDEYNIDAALTVGGPGQSGTYAIPRILKGSVTPSGKTVNTYAYSHKSDPTYVNAGIAGVTNYSSGGGRYVDYNEGIYVGYRYYETAAEEGYIDYGETVQYPFGFGLSYTDFNWNIAEVSPSSGANLTKDTKITVKVNVQNTGDTYAGQEAVEVYLTPEYTEGGIEKSHVNLIGFDKTLILGPGESQQLSFSFDAYDLASYDCYDANNNDFCGYETEAGTYEIKFMTDSHTIKENADGDELILTYHVSDDILFDEEIVITDAVTETERTLVSAGNLFTGAEAYAGVAIDGLNSDADIKYMTRSDFAGTFPSSKARARGKASNVAALGSAWQTDKSDTDMTFAQGAPGDLWLQRKVTVNGETKIEYNDELIKELGKDYDAESWEPLLDQLTNADLQGFVKTGGWKTYGASSIGKLETLDYDGPSGLNSSVMGGADTGWTAFPISTVLAQAWNPYLAYSFGLAVGAEAMATNVSGWYAPACNIHRSPYDGRNFEYYSEDPYLSGVMSADTTKGALANRLYCYVKHFAVNECETGRSGLYTWLTEQTLREIYLKPFEISVREGGANAIMTSFNRIGGVWAGGNYALMTDILRGEWGFRGMIITDYSHGGSYMDVDQGLRAGGDVWLSGTGANNVQGFDDTTSTTARACMRRAAKNVVYTWCNTYYNNATHDFTSDKYVGVMGGVPVPPFPAWIFLLIGIDLVTLGGSAVGAFFLLRRTKRIAES